ncbi:GGDEF domain-containing protein [Vibrio azureus]|uniref:diguanylate cyclase n=1 Tax=Vibrio azureus NBRC 104587 TaxID=1219077 RepID=U3ATN0_9VIBR|nr:GGDEF domain-containing protein [Vibrio azureus]AUI85871.1 GGDEF domain-containing protein [Vibrio azureus]GAD77115.1 hypothetical protein VAZ01S_062_00180 [Vibrio azureus NBRC 104587]
MKWIHKLVLVLLIFTVSSITLHTFFGDKRTINITPTQYHILPTNDGAVGGESQSSITFQNNRITLQCDLKKSQYEWPYCGVSIPINLQHKDKGLDLSNYHTVRLKLRYMTKNNSTSPSLRLYLKNYNPAYSTSGEEYTLKYNGIQFYPQAKAEVIEIPIANLQVMTWWLNDNDVSIEHSAPEFSNVTVIDIATGADTRLGEHKIIIEKIEFVGKYLELSTLLFFLLIMWMALGMGVSLYEMRKSKVAYRKARRRHRHLEKVNNNLRAQNFQFAELAHRDALTGAMNRHAIKGWLDQKVHNVKEGDNAFSILYLDVDRFKSINDVFGHLIGDDVLREFVMVLSDSITEEERLVRWGGEEFVVFCPKTSLTEAKKRAERLRRNVEQHLWVHGEKMTCSIGVAQMGNEHLPETMARADEALYQAKRNGRNRTEVHYGGDSVVKEG